MIVILRDQLVSPPSSISCVRDLTLYCSIFLKHDVLLASNDKDIYYRWLKIHGAMDFIKYIITPGEVTNGVWIDIEYNFNPSIVTDRIVAENLHQIINKLR